MGFIANLGCLMRVSGLFLYVNCVAQNSFFARSIHILLCQDLLTMF